MKKITAILSAAAMTLSALTVSAQEADYAKVLEKGIFKDSVNYVQNIDFEDAEIGTSYKAGDVIVGGYTSVSSLADDSSVTIADGGAEHGHVLDIKNSAATTGRNMLKLAMPDISKTLGKAPGLYIISADFLFGDFDDQRQLFNIKMTKTDNKSDWYSHWVRNGSISPAEGEVQTLETDKWYSVTHLVDTANGFAYTYVDNKYIGKDWISSFKGAYINEIDYGHSKSANAQTLIDNISVSYRPGGSLTLAQYNYSDKASTPTDQKFEDTSKYQPGAVAPGGNGLQFASDENNTLFTIGSDETKGQFLKASTSSAASGTALSVPSGLINKSGKFTLTMDIRFDNFNSARKIIGMQFGDKSWSSTGAWVNTDGSLSQTKNGTDFYTFDNSWHTVKWTVDTVTGTETLYVDDTQIWTLTAAASAGKTFGKVTATNPAGTVTCYDNIRLQYYEYIVPSESCAADDKFYFTYALDASNVTNVYLYNNGERVCEMTANTPVAAVLHEGTNHITAKAFNGDVCAYTSTPVTLTAPMTSERRIVYLSDNSPVNSFADIKGTDITVTGELRDKDEFSAIAILKDAHGILAGCSAADTTDGVFTCTISDLPDNITDGGYTLQVVFWDSMNTMYSISSPDIFN